MKKRGKKGNSKEDGTFNDEKLDQSRGSKNDSIRSRLDQSVAGGE